MVFENFLGFGLKTGPTFASRLPESPASLAVWRDCVRFARAGTNGPEAELARPHSYLKNAALARGLPRSAYPLQRNPILLLRFVGSFLFRFETRTFLALLFQEPPRTSAVFRFQKDKTFKQAFSDPPGIPKGRVSQPGLDASIQIGETQQAAVILPRHSLQPAAHADNVAACQAYLLREQTPSQKRHSFGAAIHTRFPFMQPKPQTRQKVSNTLAHFSQRGLVVSKKDEIVHVAQIPLWPQFPKHELIERVQINVGEELRGLIADRQAAPTLERSEQVIAWEICGRFLLRVRLVKSVSRTFLLRSLRTFLLRCAAPALRHGRPDAIRIH